MRNKFMRENKFLFPFLECLCVCVFVERKKVFQQRDKVSQQEWKRSDYAKFTQNLSLTLHTWNRDRERERERALFVTMICLLRFTLLTAVVETNEWKM